MTHHATIPTMAALPCETRMSVVFSAFLAALADFITAQRDLEVSVRADCSASG